jgi:hypothetical protein
VNSIGSGAAFAHDADFDRSALRATHAPDGVRQCAGIHGNAVDRHNDVAGANSRLRRRRTLEWCDHDDLFVLDRQVDADAGIAARAADLDLIVFITVEIGRIGVERCHHAANRRLQQLMVVHRIHVVVLHPLEHRSQHARVLPRQIRAQEQAYRPERHAPIRGIGRWRCRRPAKERYQIY